MPAAADKVPEEAPTEPETPIALESYSSVTRKPVVTAPRASVEPDDADNKPIHVDDGHRWRATWKSADGKRESQECMHGDACGAKRYRDGGKWTIGPVAPWVAAEHVEAHAKARIGRK